MDTQKNTRRTAWDTRSGNKKNTSSRRRTLRARRRTSARLGQNKKITSSRGRRRSRRNSVPERLRRSKKKASTRRASASARFRLSKKKRPHRPHWLAPTKNVALATGDERYNIIFKTTSEKVERIKSRLGGEGLPTGFDINDTNCGKAIKEAIIQADRDYHTEIMDDEELTPWAKTAALNPKSGTLIDRALVAAIKAWRECNGTPAPPLPPPSPAYDR